MTITKIKYYAFELLEIKSFWTQQEKAKLYGELALVLGELTKYQSEWSQPGKNRSSSDDINRLIRKIRNRLKVLPSEKTDMDYIAHELLPQKTAEITGFLQSIA